MNNHIKEFINEHYISFNFSDLIFRIIGYFIYSFIMIVPAEFILTDVQKNAFIYISLTEEYARPLVIGAVILSTTVSIITIILYTYKAKWSVIAIRGISFLYISLTLLGLSCFSNFAGSIVDIISIILKILSYFCCILLYKKYLVTKNYLSKYNIK